MKQTKKILRLSSRKLHGYLISSLVTGWLVGWLAGWLVSLYNRSLKVAMQGRPLMHSFIS
jgi:hypothetical protein